MPTCQQIVELGGRFLDGEQLTQQEVAQMTDHLGTCSQCRHDFGDTEKITAKIRELFERTKLTPADKADLKRNIFKQTDPRGDSSAPI